MADVFKNGILYMDSLNDSDIFNDIIREQEEKQRQKEERAEKKSKDKLIAERAAEIEKKTIEAFKEIEEKMHRNPNTILFDEDGKVCASNGYGIKLVQKGERTELRVIIPD